MRLGITFMRGGNMIRHLSKKDGMEVSAGILARVPGVGQETAEALVKRFGSVGQVATLSKHPDFANVKIGNRKLGKKAEAICDAFWRAAA